jgi:hypothetical protein
VQPVSLLIESKALNERETGRAQLILGVAYHQQGEWDLAQTAKERTNFEPVFAP